MTAACRRQGVQFHGWVMFMHNPRLPRIRELLDDGQSIGDIKRVMSYFSFHLSEAAFEANVRVNSDLEPDRLPGRPGLVFHPVSPLWALNWELPNRVVGRILSQRGSSRSPAPVPMDFPAELIYDRGSVRRLLLFLLRPIPELGEHSGRAGLRAGSGFCASAKPS